MAKSSIVGKLGSYPVEENADVGKLFFFTGPDSISYSALMFLFYNSLQIGHDKNRQTQEWVWPASHSLPNPEL